MKPWQPGPAYWRVLHGAGFFYLGCPVAAGMTWREGRVRGKKTGPAALLSRPPRVVKGRRR